MLIFAPVLLQAAHITDKLLAGMYAEPSSAGAPIKLLPSGTPVELQTEKAGFVKILLVDGQTGWVEKRFLSDEKPSKVRLLALQSKYRQQQAKIGLYEKELLSLKKQNNADAVTKSNKNDKRLKDLGSALSDSKASLLVIKAENNKLLSQLDELVKTSLTKKQPPKPISVKPVQPAEQPYSVYWILLIIPVCLVVGLVWGMRMQDERQLQKHGGFRI